MDSIQEIIDSQSQSKIDFDYQKKAGHLRIKTIRMDFGGNLSLTKSGIWVYVKGSGKYRITKSTKQRDYDKAVTVAKRIHTLTIIEGESIATNDSKKYAEIYRNCRKNSKQRNIDFSLSEDDMRILVTRAGGRCEVTGIVFQKIPNMAQKVKQPFFPSIDRIDSSKGYSLDNCRLVCVAANFALNTWGDWVLMELMRAMHIKHGKISVSALKNRIRKSRAKK